MVCITFIIPGARAERVGALQTRTKVLVCCLAPQVLPWYRPRLPRQRSRAMSFRDTTWISGCRARFGTIVADIAAAVADAVADSVFSVADLADYMIEYFLFISN